MTTPPRGERVSLRPTYRAPNELCILRVQSRYYRTYSGQGVWVKLYLSIPDAPTEGEHDRFERLRELTNSWIRHLYVTHPDEHQAYSDGLSMEAVKDGKHSRLTFSHAEGSPKFEEVYRQGYTENIGKLEYLPRANVYRYEQSVTVNAATIGALTELERMAWQNLKELSDGWAAEEIRRLLEVLNAFWD